MSNINFEISSVTHNFTELELKCIKEEFDKRVTELVSNHSEGYSVKHIEFEYSKFIFVSSVTICGRWQDLSLSNQEPNWYFSGSVSVSPLVAIDEDGKEYKVGIEAKEFEV